MSLGESIRKNTLWLFGGNVSGILIHFGIGIILARLLTPADFGFIVTIQVFTGALAFVAGGGLGEALVQSKEIKPDDFLVIFTVQLFIGLLIFIAFFFLAPWFSRWFDNPIYTDLVRVSALSFLIRPFGNLPRAQLRRDMRFDVIAINRIISALIAGATSITMAAYGMGPWSLILSGLLGALITSALLYRSTNLRPALAFNKYTAKKFAGYGLKFSLNEIVAHLRTQTPNLIISRMLGPAMVGLFNKADSLKELPIQVIGGSVYQTIFRALSSLQDNTDKSKYLYLKAVTLVSVYTVPFYIGFIWVAESFILTVYGDQWGDAAMALQILALAGIFRCITNPSGAVIAARGLLGRELIIQFEVWGILLTGCIVGIRWGIEGIALGILPSAFYQTVRMASLAGRSLNISLADLGRALTPALVLNSLLMLTLYLADSLLNTYYTETPGFVDLIIKCLAGISVYGALFLFAPFEELISESNRWKKLLTIR